MTLPKHIAIIMDGNGRWATQRDLARAKGHKAGVDAADRVVEAAVALGIEHLSLYAFSTENWKRPALEVETLMAMLRIYLKIFASKLIANNVKFHHLGLLDGIPEGIQKELKELEHKTAHCTGTHFHLAVNYGSRLEIIETTKQFLREGLDPDALTEELFTSSLWTGSAPDVDLLIRTGGDQRISNFLLWQSAYAEMVTLETFWPDFDRLDLEKAIDEFHRRDRRYGGVADTHEFK